MLKSYEKYKEVNAVWLDKIPSHWNCEKVGMNFIERKTKVSDRDYPPLSVTKKGVVPQLETAAKSNDGDNRKLVLSGDFVINSRSDRKGSSGLSKLDGSVSLINIVLEPRTIDSNYTHYLLKSYGFIEEYYRVGRGIVADLWTTRYSEMRNILIPIPPLSEQEQIVRYLKSRLAKINKFIKTKKKLILALKEQKQAVVNEAVTKGLNPNVTTKYSGVDWIGDIPEHWEIKSLRQLLKPISVKNRADLPLLSVVREKGVILRSGMSREENHNFIPDDLSGYKVVEIGQFAMNKMKAWQGSYGVSQYQGIVSPAYYIFNLFFGNKDYFHHAIRSKVYVNFFYQASDGIRVGQWDLSLEKMKNIPFFIPPEKEQEEIVSYILNEFGNIEDSILKLQKEIELLTEYSTRLISDVVTGKVDVRNIPIDGVYGNDLTLAGEGFVNEDDEDDETEEVEEFQEVDA